MGVKLNGVIVGNKCYPNNERMFDNISKNIYENNGEACVWVQYQCSADFETFLTLVAYINTLPIKKKVLDMWYMPYLRMDRQVGSKDPMKRGMINILETVCEDWNLRTLDPHSGVERLANYVSAISFINHVITKENINLICFPDKGANDRYGKYFAGIISTTYSDKERDINTGEITRISICEHPDYEGRNILIADDICSYGGTANGVAEQLKGKGASRVVAWFSHTEQSIYRGRIFTDNFIDKVYTSNSIMDCGEHITFLTLNKKGDVIEL